jgi:tRNA/rRNA methyltransferase
MNLAVVLVSPRNPLNIGAAARAMSNFGFSDLRVVNPYEKAFREAVSAVGGAPVLQSARVFETVAAAIEDCSLVVGTTSIASKPRRRSCAPIWTPTAPRFSSAPKNSVSPTKT